MNAKALIVIITVQVTDDLVNYILVACPKLRNLNLQNCRKLSDLALSHMVETAVARQPVSQITALHLGGNFNLTAEGKYKENCFFLRD